MSVAGDDLQRIHDASRGAFECAKNFRLRAFFCELLAAGITLRGVIVYRELVNWLPLIVCALLAASVYLRNRSQRYNDIALSCRRTSVRAYAFGQRIPIVVSNGLLNAVPTAVRKLGAALPGGSIQEYYGATMAVGEGRLRYLYAYSSFFTWRVIRGTAFFYGFSAVVVLVLIGMTLYGIAIHPIDPSARSVVLEALFPIVLGVLGLRLLEEALAARSCESSMQGIADRLISSPLPSGDELNALVADYEFAIVAMPTPPSTVYKVLRRSLEESWAHRRQAVTD